MTVRQDAEHSISSKKYARISEARSYLATRNHARRRQSQDPTGFGADPLLQTSANIRPYTCAEKETSAQLGRATRCRNRSPNTNVSNPHAIQGFKGFHESKSLSPMVTGIHCALDPFLQVKLDLSTQEKSLIHFYLLVGRCWLLDTPPTTSYCPALDIAQSVIQICPIYALAHIIIAESLFSRLTRRPLRELYYDRYSQMYRQLNDLLSDQEASPYRKLWALIQVAMVEGTVKRFDLQALHTTAMDDFIESQDGITSCRVEKGDEAFAQVASRLFAGRLVRGSALVTSDHRFATIRTRFMQVMNDICSWTALVYEQVSAAAYVSSDDELDWLPIYMDQLELQQLRSITESVDQSPCHEAVTSTLSMVLTFVECELDLIAARSFLASVQAHICGSIPYPSKKGSAEHSVNPVVVAYNISCARTQSFPDPNCAREMKISQAIADAQRILAMLDPATATTIVMWLVGIVNAVSRTRVKSRQVKLGLSSFGRNQLQALEQEIGAAWKSRPQSAYT